MNYVMERALTFSYVRQLPRSSLQEVQAQETAYDRQVLLNEVWEKYCERIGRADLTGQKPHRDKWVTETWDEWSVRKLTQPADLQKFLEGLDTAQEAHRAKSCERTHITEKILSGIRKDEAARRAELLPVLHTLQLDFEERQAEEHAKTRNIFVTAETTARDALEADVSQEYSVLKQLETEGQEHIAALMEQRRLAEQARLEAMEAQREKERAEEEEAARLKAEQDQRNEEARIEAERLREQEEKDRKAAERKARIASEREKRKNKEEEAAVRRDSRRRSSGKSSGETKALRRTAARGSRLERQKDDMAAFLVQLPPRVAECRTQDQLDALLSAVANELGLLLFDTAVYIAVDTGATLHYKYASQNCSALLRASQESFPPGEHPNCPAVSAKRDGTHILLRTPFQDDSIADTLVRVGTKEALGDGDFLVVPIRGASGEVTALLNADTFVDLNARQDNLMENEKDVYEAEGPIPAAAISEEMVVFLQEVARLLSDAFISGSVPDVTESTSLSSLYAQVTKTIAAYAHGLNCYISMFSHPRSTTATIVAQNGKALGESTDESSFTPHTNVLGAILDGAKQATSPTITLSLNEGSRFIDNVKEVAEVVCYKGETEKKEDFLLIHALWSEVDGVNVKVGVLGVEGSAAHPLAEGHRGQIALLVEQMCGARTPLCRSRLVKMYCDQCTQWCAALSGCHHVYISLKQSYFKASGGTYEYITSTPSTKFILGKTIPEGKGVTETTVSAGKAVHHLKVSGLSPEVHFVDSTKNAECDGQLMLAPIGDFGAIYMDTVGWTEGKKNFSEADLMMLETAADQLAKLINDTSTAVDVVIPEGEATLQIENDVNPACVRFLKKMYLRSVDALTSITKQDMLEMAKYNQPPEAIPPVCAATFIVMGKKPGAVATWEKTRKLLKYPVLAKMAKFDPTGAKPARAFFIRAKKLTKGFSVDIVAKKGSVPTSLFFNWMSVNVQLRYAAVRFRKLAAEGQLELGSTEAEDEGMDTDACSSMGATTEGADEDVDEGDDDDDAEEEDPAEAKEE